MRADLQGGGRLEIRLKCEAATVPADLGVGLDALEGARDDVEEGSGTFDADVGEAGRCWVHGGDARRSLEALDV